MVFWRFQSENNLPSIIHFRKTLYLKFFDAFKGDKSWLIRSKLKAKSGEDHLGICAESNCFQTYLQAATQIVKFFFEFFWHFAKLDSLQRFTGGLS